MAAHGLILLVGPDGGGKSTIAAGLAALARSHEVRFGHGHYRPALLGRRAGPAPLRVDAPHAEESRSVVAGLVKLLVLVVDWTVGYAVLWRPVRREGVMVVERGWFDMVIDPRRYRLRPQLRRLVAALGRLLPAADLVVLLEGSPATIHARKPEIGEEEVKRQIEEWRLVAPRAGHRVLPVDTTAATPERIAGRIWDEMARVESGTAWRKVPFSPSRLELHVWGKVPPSAWIHHSYRLTPRMVDPIRPVLAGLGRRRRVDEPLQVLPALCSKLELQPTGLLAMRSSTPGRWIVGLSEGPHLSTVFKVGSPDDLSLQSEARVLATLSTGAERIAVPRLLWAGEFEGFFVVATAAVDVLRHGQPSVNQVRDVCSDLVRGDGRRPPLVHGDLAPWNVTLCGSGMVGVFDWEHAQRDRRPLWDLSHYLIQSGALLHNYSPAAVVRLLTGDGSPGWRHLLDCDVDPTCGPYLLSRYLDTAPPFARMSARFRAEVARCLKL